MYVYIYYCGALITYLHDSQNLWLSKLLRLALNAYVQLIIVSRYINYGGHNIRWPTFTLLTVEKKRKSAALVVEYIKLLIFTMEMRM